jgi:uncharacterized protein YegJ (DUF2314 family)
MSYDDPKLKATIDEAQRRWPEFAAAFVKRRPGQTFGVKREFVDGDVNEYMWVVVESIDGTQITGKLDNAPLKIKNVKPGDVIVLDKHEVLDWMYEEGKEMRGGFSLKVLSGG